ncbi:uncharacterized protein K452DRAFT_313103 [Aplosporella prunicola CBS 121167]|uniref:Uncharacterized protein n=1 Tax=Aplosporella prunicola CBS 121167 TaxID=1176127 RepID=A0A6A6AZV4_9PEZI|nr:uncharacterized protein K452DRAFT_313103 [Aplosporella prunicola CBS 121167]KAF2136544.1 hypothetical protein K452DRAFT_313103 [Aplosporella prunicola CBS 121167]
MKPLGHATKNFAMHSRDTTYVSDKLSGMGGSFALAHRQRNKSIDSSSPACAATTSARRHATARDHSIHIGPQHNIIHIGSPGPDQAESSSHLEILQTFEVVREEPNRFGKPAGRLCDVGHKLAAPHHQHGKRPRLLVRAALQWYDAVGLACCRQFVGDPRRQSGAAAHTAAFPRKGVAGSTPDAWNATKCFTWE